MKKLKKLIFGPISLLWNFFWFAYNKMIRRSPKNQVKKVAHARSGDKGEDSNIGVIAYTKEGYLELVEKLTEERVQNYFSSLGVKKTTRYLLPNLHALNFVLQGALPGGGSRSLRVDAQGKALGQALLEMEI
jgi:hypothetical protein